MNDPDSKENQVNRAIIDIVITDSVTIAIFTGRSLGLRRETPSFLPGQNSGMCCLDYLLV